MNVFRFFRFADATMMNLKISGDAAHGWSTYSPWYWPRFCWLERRRWRWSGWFATVAVLHGKKIRKFSSICILCWWWPVSSLYLDFVSLWIMKHNPDGFGVVAAANLLILIISWLNISIFAAILLYRLCRCLKHIYAKLAHTLFHALAIPCIGLGFLAVWDSHNLANPPIPNFYSLHSWLGLVTMGLFVLQFVFGFFT